MSDIKVGDRVKVAIEGTVGEVLRLGDNNTVYGLGFVNQFGNGSHTVFTNQDDVTVEKIEPPVETFGPGDVVRAKGIRGVFESRALGRDGYLAFPGGRFYRYGTDGFQASEFTSDRYERVEI